MHISVVSRKTHEKKDTLFIPYTHNMTQLLERFNDKDAKYIEEYAKDTGFGMEDCELIKLPEMGNTVLLCGIKEMMHSIASGIRKYHHRITTIVYDMEILKAMNIDDEMLARIITNATVLGSYDAQETEGYEESSGLTKMIINVADDKIEWYRKLYDIAYENAKSTLDARILSNSSIVLEGTDKIMEAVRKALGRKFKTKIYRAKDFKLYKYRGIAELSEYSKEEPVMIIAEHKAERGKTIALCASLLLHPFQTTSSLKKQMLPLGIATAIANIHTNTEKDTSLLIVISIANLKETSSLIQKPIRLGCGSSYELESRDTISLIPLSDTIYAASKYKPRQIISLNSDTIGFSSFLGTGRAAYLSNSDVSTQLLDDAGKNALEKVYRLPLEYSEEVHTGIRKNYRLIGSDNMESWIHNARMLEVNSSGYPWMHIDLSACNHTTSSYGIMSRGSTGYGAALINEYLKILENKG
ncbi:MAG: hypothetical protein ACMXYL_00255 [Candidatus Woesearchaeota archaeon]